MRNAHLIFSIWPWSQVRRRVNFLKLKDRYLSRAAKSLESVGKLSNPSNNFYLVDEQAEIVEALSRMLYQTIDKFPSPDKWIWYMRAEQEHYAYLSKKDPKFFDNLPQHVKDLVDSSSNDKTIRKLEQMQDKLDEANFKLETLLKATNKLKR